MDNVFLDIVKETLTNNGIDISNMTDEEIVSKFKELESKSEEVKDEVVEQVAEKAEEGVDDEETSEELPQPNMNPTKLV